MSSASDVIKQQFPGRRITFLAPRELDGAIVMVEEQLDEPCTLRVIYSEEAVTSILTNSLKWPYNKVSNYLRTAYAWRLSTRRAPAILTRDEIRDLKAGTDIDKDEREGDYEDSDIGD